MPGPPPLPSRRKREEDGYSHPMLNDTKPKGLRRAAAADNTPDPVALPQMGSSLSGESPQRKQRGGRPIRDKKNPKEMTDMEKWEAEQRLSAEAGGTGGGGSKKLGEGLGDQSSLREIRARRKKDALGPELEVLGDEAAERRRNFRLINQARRDEENARADARAAGAEEERAESLGCFDSSQMPPKWGCIYNTILAIIIINMLVAIAQVGLCQADDWVNLANIIVAAGT